MKLIPLSQGKYARVDDADFDYLTQWKWYAIKHRLTFYAVRTVYNPVKKRIWMHRVIMNTDCGMHTDHKDGDGLNNQRLNLRAATNKENCRNRQKFTGSSIYKGVSQRKQGAGWTAQIAKDGKDIYIGSFLSQEAAAIAYNQKARELFGEFAWVNKIQTRST